MSEHRVVAVIKAKEAKEKELEKVLHEVIVETHKEPGCVLYAFHKVPADPKKFVFIEKWKDVSALKSHLSAPHIARAFARKEELIESIDILSLEPQNIGQSEKELI
ncbi:MAG: putative quinol monooxygenase [Elusimicrobiota bacterium]